jgi:hypothetical protein
MPVSYCTFCNGLVGGQPFRISGSGLWIVLCATLYGVVEP